MINKLKNEQGYALVTVILIFLLLTLLMITFTTVSGSTMKQNARSEEKQQAVALAEMGVSYFQHAVENLFTYIMDDVENIIFEEKDTYTVIQHIANKLQEKVENKNLHNLKIPLQDSEIKTAYYQIQFDPEKDITFEKDIITIYFTSFGKINNAESKIQSTLTLDFKNSIQFQDSGNDDHYTDDKIYDVVIRNSQELKDKLEGEPIKNKKILIIGNHNLDLDGTFYFENSIIEARQNIDNKNVSIKLILNNNSAIEIRDYSKFYIFVKLHTLPHSTLKLYNNSKLYVVGDVQVTAIKDNLEIDETSKMCIDGMLTGNKNHLKAIERIEENKGENPNFLEECMGKDGTSFTVKLEKPRLTFNHRYD